MDKQTQVDGAVGSDGGGSRSVGEYDGFNALADGIHKVHPGRWEIEVDGNVMDLYGDNEGFNWSPDWPDTHNASFIVFALDLLQHQGMKPLLRIDTAWGYAVVIGEDDGGIEFDDIPDHSVFPIKRESFHGSTRSLALLAALAAYLAQAPGLSNTEGTADQSDSTKEDV